MKRIISVLLVAILPLASYAEPPQINVAKDGTTTIKSGSNVVTILPDGSLKVQSPVLNLTIGGSDPVVPVPPGPTPPPVVNDFQELYNKDTSDADAKKATLALFIRIWTDAADKVNEFNNSQQVNDLVSPQLKALGKPLAAIRSAVGAELQKSFPEPVELTPELKRSLTEKINAIVTKLQGVK